MYHICIIMYHANNLLLMIEKLKHFEKKLISYKLKNKI